MIKFRRLNADEIDARVATVKSDGVSLLLYKDARVDQNILDETVGAERWQRSHQLIGNNLYCTVSIYIPEMDAWVEKQDVGTESYTEKEKGQASDSFKRACFNWGIGRELYTAPFIWIKAGNVKIEKGRNGNDTTYDFFKVQSIDYDEKGNINQLVIYNTKQKKIAYTFGNTKEKAAPIEDKPAIVYPSRDEMIKLVSKSYPEGSKNLAALLGSFGVDALEKASDAQLQAVYNKVHK